MFSSGWLNLFALTLLALLSPNEHEIRLPVLACALGYDGAEFLGSLELLGQCGTALALQECFDLSQLESQLLLLDLPPQLVQRCRAQQFLVVQLAQFLDIGCIVAHYI